MQQLNKTKQKKKKYPWVRFERQENITLSNESETPYQNIFAIDSLWSMQSNAFDRSVERAANSLPLPTGF